MSDQPYAELYAQVDNIHREHPLASRDTQHTAAVTRERRQRVLKDINDHAAQSIALAYSELLTQTGLNQLPAIPDDPSVESYEMIQDSTLLGGRITIGRVISDKGATAQVCLAESKHAPNALAIK
jgi:hypothetical protein